MATTIPQGTTIPSIQRGAIRRVALPAALALALVMGITWGVRRWAFARTHESTDNAQVDGHVVPAMAKVGGYVADVAVSENQPVTAGQLLVRLDDAEFRVRLAQAEAELAAAEATAGTSVEAGQAQAQVATATGQRGALDAQVTSARANAARAESDLRRYSSLAADQLVSRQGLDAARAAATSARASVTALEREAAAASASVQSARAGVRLASARVRAARAARDNALLQLSYARIVAPEAGRVSRKTVEVGQLVQPGQPLMAIVGDSGAWVTANFKETQVSDMRVGQSVALAVDAYGDCSAEGVVQSLASATGARFALLPPDNASGNFTKVVQRIPVRVRVTKGCGVDRPLRPGMSVEASVKTK